MTEKEMICICCPKGCLLKASYNNRTDLSVSGNGCQRGIEYADSEIFKPMRMVTATAAAKQNQKIRIPVKSSAPVEKKDIPQLLDSIYSVRIELPVTSGDVIIQNYNNTGIDIVATKSVEK